MNTSLVDKVANAVLYEGYILYPYRASSRKNRERFTFGRVYPRDYSDGQHGAEPCVMQTQCLVCRTGNGASIGGRIRFLHAMAREVCAASPWGDPDHFTVVRELRIDGRVFQTWHEAVEREVALPETPVESGAHRFVDFSFPDSRTVEPLEDSTGRVAGFVRRRQHALAGKVELTVEPIDSAVARVTVRITNHTPIVEGDLDDSETVLLRTFASTHTILRASAAQFLSLTDPPPEHALAATGCDNIGTWPVLVGDEKRQERDTMLSSPIILYDYPQIAPESAGDLCDGLEIDEILTLRVMTMTAEEKNEMRNVDAYARRILERTESLRDHDLLKMHGVMRHANFPGGDFFDEHTRLDHVSVRGVALQLGDRVRITPKNRADAMDMMLAGKIGLIEAIEQDAEGGVHLALVLEEDPGRDLGMMRQPGHRFFYALDEVEPLREGE
jgi:hydrogenase maturation protease